VNGEIKLMAEAIEERQMFTDTSDIPDG